MSGCVLVIQEELWGHRNILSKCHAGYFFGEQQLADYLCIDRAAMSTEISKLQKEKIIKTNRKHFELNVCDDTGRSFR